MNLVIGMPVKDRGWILPEWFAAVEPQVYELRNTYHCHVELVTMYTASSDNTLAVLQDHEIEVLTDPRPGRDVVKVNSHIWGAIDAYSYLAELRNSLVDWALAGQADYFFSLDSDIILPPNGLVNLLGFAQHRIGVFAPAVNMAMGSVEWNVMSWIDKEHPNLAHRRAVPKESEVDVIMAAMLLDRTGMTVDWMGHLNGEDVGFCVDAVRKGVKRYWVPEIKCEHRMAKY